MDEYDELYGVSGGNNDSYYGNQDIYGDDQDNSQSYDPEKATLYSNQPNKAEGQSQQEKSDNNPTYDQQQQYYGSDADNTRDQPKQREYDQAHEQDQSNQSVEGQEEHESHPSVASAANQDEGIYKKGKAAFARTMSLPKRVDSIRLYDSKNSPTISLAQACSSKLYNFK